MTGGGNKSSEDLTINEVMEEIKMLNLLNSHPNILKSVASYFYKNELWVKCIHWFTKKNQLLTIWFIKQKHIWNRLWQSIVNMALFLKSLQSVLLSLWSKRKRNPKIVPKKKNRSKARLKRRSYLLYRWWSGEGIGIYAS